MEEIIFSLKHYWRLWTPKLLNSKHFHREWPRKPHEHRPNAEIGKVSPMLLEIQQLRLNQQSHYRPNISLS